jgi:hypothetical protein
MRTFIYTSLLNRNRTTELKQKPQKKESYRITEGIPGYCNIYDSNESGQIMRSARSDTVLLVSYDPENTTTALISEAGSNKSVSTGDSVYFQNEKLTRAEKKTIKEAQKLELKSHPAWRLAKASKVLGILSFFTVTWVTGPLAIVFGSVAVERLKSDPEWRIERMAKVGLICGIISYGIVVLICTILIMEL